MGAMSTASLHKGHGSYLNLCLPAWQFAVTADSMAGLRQLALCGGT